MEYIVFIVYVITTVSGMILVKLGGKTCGILLSHLSLNLQVNVIFIAGVALYAISFLLWMYLLQKFTITYISPIAYGVVFILTAALARIIFKEEIAFRQAIGIIAILVGVFVAS